MDIKEVNDLISLMAAVSCSEIDGSMCYDYTHQIDEFLRKYPKEVREHFVECWTTVSRCNTLNNKLNSKPSEKWQAICKSLDEERTIHNERIRIKKKLEILRNQIIPDYLHSEVAKYKGNAKDSGEPCKYLTNCIVNWTEAIVSGVEVFY